MKSLQDLLPELRDWNDGKGVDALHYVVACATSDMAIAFIGMFWPEFRAFENYVFRVGFDLENVWACEKSWSQPQVEAAVNYLGLGNFFPNEPASPLLDERIKFIGDTVSDIYRLKLARDFPDRMFSVVLCTEEDDYYLTFFQV